MHEELHRALDAALRDQPDDLALRAARSGWSRPQRALEEAKAQMLRANLRLVIYMAKRYLNDEVPFLDLVQEGNIGLMRGLEKFEPSRGLKFVTILRLRFGLDTDRPQTLSEIGDLYGLSRERIRQLETLALKKLRGSKPRALLADFVDAA